MLRVVALGVIRFYQLAISPYTPPSCRFAPSCSAYAHTAVQRFGVFRGGWLFLRRFARCHPFGGEGYDPVPLPSDPRPQVHAGSEPPSGLSPASRDGAS